MNHVVYLDAKAKELDNLLSGQKTMIIRGATGRKLPYGRVNPEDILFFIQNNAEGTVKATAKVKSVINSDKLSPEASATMVKEHQDKLQLTDTQIKKWAGKRYLVFIEVKEVKEITPFPIDKSSYGNMDDWLLVEHIENVKKIT